MNIFKPSILALFLGFTTAASATNLQLEHCINGQVSASGLYETDAGEQAARVALWEPCIVGDVE